MTQPLVRVVQRTARRGRNDGGPPHSVWVGRRGATTRAGREILQQFPPETWDVTGVPEKVARRLLDRYRPQLDRLYDQLQEILQQRALAPDDTELLEDSRALLTAIAVEQSRQAESIDDILRRHWPAMAPEPEALQRVREILDA